jgi:hypothetical protein
LYSFQSWYISSFSSFRDNYKLALEKDLEEVVNKIQESNVTERDSDLGRREKELFDSDNHQGDIAKESRIKCNIKITAKFGIPDETNDDVSGSKYKCAVCRQCALSRLPTIFTF